MKSLANIIHGLAHHFQPHDETPRSWRDLHDYDWWVRHPDQHPEVVQVAQKTTDQHQAAGSPAQATPNRQEVLNYLGQLAKDYRLPPKLVYAVADAETQARHDRLDLACTSIS